MKPLRGYWLDRAAAAATATPSLGFEMVGGHRGRARKERECRACGGPLALLSVYRRGPFIPLEKFAAILLEICAECARESDGSSGASGYVVRFAGPRTLLASLRSQ